MSTASSELGPRLAPLMSVGDIMQSCVFVEGTACVGKSSALRLLQSLVPDPENVFPGDFCEDVARFPLYAKKDKFKYINKCYTSSLILKVQANAVYDRCFLSDFLYEVVSDILARKCEAIRQEGETLLRLTQAAAAKGESPPEEDAHQQPPGLYEELLDCVMLSLEPAVVEQLKRLRVLVCIDGDVPGVLARMRRRGNGIDILTQEYVEVQNAVFRRVAQVFGWPVLDKHATDPEMGSFVTRIAHTVLAMRTAPSFSS